MTSSYADSRSSLLASSSGLDLIAKLHTARLQLMWLLGVWRALFQMQFVEVRKLKLVDGDDQI